MLNIQRALRSNQLMRALTGMNVTEFENLVITFKAVLAKHRAKAKSKRQRAIGGGRKHTLKTTPERLFFILFYLKCYPTMAVSAFFYNVDRSRIQCWVKELLPVLEETLGREVVLPKRKIEGVEAFYQQFPMVKDVFIDGTERPTQRPQQGKSQRHHYSGRKKCHTKKNLLMTDDQQQILLLSPTKPGARTDYFRFKQSGFAEALPPDVTAWVDLGFVGIHKDYPHLAVMMPVKKPKNKCLTPAQRQENHLIRGIRIVVEHALAGVKRFRALTDICRNKTASWSDKFMLLACGLWNYHRRFA